MKSAVMKSFAGATIAMAVLAGGASTAFASPNHPTAEEIVARFQPATDQVTAAEFRVLNNSHISVGQQEVIVDRLSGAQSAVDSATFELLERFGLI